MKYFFDFEFSEYFITKGFWKWKRQYHVIEPISLGMVCEDGRELEIIFNDFDVDHAWNKHDIELPKEHGDEPVKNYWLRDNVLSALQTKMFKRLNTFAKSQMFGLYQGKDGFKRLLQEQGRTKEEAKKLIIDFCQELEPDGFICFTRRSAPKFYAYFADYDWVVFCSIFGRMIDLPTSKGFPMYCNDLKQLMEDKARQRRTTSEMIKKKPSYPVQNNEHDALEDAKWNQKLYSFLINI